MKQGHDRQGVETAGRERLDWDPSLDASDIGVSRDEGVVTLRGNVASYAEKMAAERFALRVLGVTQVEDRLT